VAELRGARDVPDDGDASARRLPADAGNDAGEARTRREPSSRAEYTDVIRQNVAQMNTQTDARHVDPDQADPAPEDADPEGKGQANIAQEIADQTDAAPDVRTDDAGRPITYAEDARPENAGQADTDQGDAVPADADPGDAQQEDSNQVDAGRAETDQSTEGSIADALERFDPRRAGLPEVSREEAATYIAEHQADRPWLAPAADCSPDAQRVIVALDQGHGHGHIRHDGWVTEEMNERRVRNLEDPAQLDPQKREAHVDGVKTGDQLHRCGILATRITDPAAFATAIARATEHPEVRAALDSTSSFSVPVRLPISDVLGEDGHKFCSGWQLEPVDGSMIEAAANRTAWAHGDRSVPEPKTRPVETFEGGTVTFTFRPSAIGGHEINTVLINPPDTQSM
jgi:hypothetical protein